MKKYCRVEERNILHIVEEWKINWTGHILRRNCLLKYVTEGKRIDVMGKRGRRRKQLLDDLQGNERIVKMERGSTRSQSLEDWPRKRLWMGHQYTPLRE